MATRRRTTLTAVSNASLNSRASISSTRASMAATKRTSIATAGTSQPARFSITAAGGGRRNGIGGGQRPSLASNAGERKTSVGHHRRSSATANGAAKADPRPLSDKAYMAACIRALVEYLSDHDYDQPINPKALTRPSGRDFNNIMGFLFRQIDCNYMPPARFEDDVIPMLKAIHYPFQLSKSSLAAVGAPQTWPKVMGAISWVVEYLVYRERVEDADEEERAAALGKTQEPSGDIEECVYSESMFKRYVHLAYAHYMEGDDDSYNTLSEDVERLYANQNSWVEQKQQELADAKERAVVTAEELRARSNSLPKLEEKERELERYISQLNGALEEMQKFRHIIGRKIETRTKEVQELKAETASVVEEQANVRERVAAQEISAEDVQRMARERKLAEQGIKEAEEFNAKAAKDIWELEKEKAAKLEHIKGALRAYTHQAENLMLVPRGAKNAGGVDFELHITPENVGDPDALLSNDVKGNIRPSFSFIEDAVRRKTNDSLMEISALLDVEYSTEDELSALTDKCTITGNKLRRAEEVYSREKLALDQTEGKNLQMVDDMELRLEELRHETGDVNARAEASRERAARLEAELEAFKQESAASREIQHSAILEALSLGTDFQESTGIILRQLKERCRQYLVNATESKTALDLVLADGDKGWEAGGNPTVNDGPGSGSPDQGKADSIGGAGFAGVKDEEA